ncbi:unnamed protein product [Citrullus colocynthis]|uniref:Uncharacterized protein n=1 Tax=Citrullus colocynthis TaxID=252529 RepID=A0ABP0XMN9_9ROSI
MRTRQLTREIQKRAKSADNGVLADTWELSVKMGPEKTICPYATWFCRFQFALTTPTPHITFIIQLGFLPPLLLNPTSFHYRNLRFPIPIPIPIPSFSLFSPSFSSPLSISPPTPISLSPPPQHSSCL